LLGAAEAALRVLAVTRLWLVTTNDNLAALALYQKAGYRLLTLRRGAVDASRSSIKPSIAEVGENGIPIRDELELAKQL
jgi:RimJ/RimL family protein N-acetyltransferase